jgi:hypothetical protein
VKQAKQRGELVRPPLGPSGDDLSDSQIAEFVAEYCRSHALRDSDDPINDMARLLRAACEMPGAAASRNGFTFSGAGPGERPYQTLIRFVAAYLFAANPTLTKRDWARVYGGILAARYGGSYVRIRKRPQLAKLLDARAGMSVERLMEAHGISRSRAFTLRKLALKKTYAEVAGKPKKN